MNHIFSVFANSCVKVPVDPVSKMPKSAYERKTKLAVEQCSIDSSSTVGSVSAIDLDAGKVKAFFRSIPDYNDINHLPPEEFYSTLKILREKKKMMGHALDHLDDINGHHSTTKLLDVEGINNYSFTNKTVKSKISHKFRRKYSAERSNIVSSKKTETDKENSSPILPSDIPLMRNTIAKEPRKTNFTDLTDKARGTTEINSEVTKSEGKPKRNHSACSISWNDKIEGYEIDHKFQKFFEGKNYSKKVFDDDDFKTQSMPSSPLRNRRFGSPLRGRKSITIPKPFKMTERDEDERVVNELRCLRKSLSDDMLHRKRDRKRFRARPVPIESRIPLYDKILEDQAMRRAITKINSEADLRAQMRPFNFTKREETCLKTGICDRVLQTGPKPKKKKRFRAKPVPKDLFSNYIYDKIKQDDFFRTFNRRVRAEEMLRNASLPGSMAARDRSRLSTPAAHSDLPIDPSPLVPSVTSSGRRTTSPSKEPKRRSKARQEFVTTSPQPFHLNTAERAAKKVMRDMEELQKRMNEESRTTPSVGGSGAEAGGRALSALELRAHAAGRSNLAALLRAEAVRRRFETEAAMRQADYRRRMELRTRDRLLRTNPSWQLVKNNHEEDIAMRLQTRRDEERMRREEFLHEMEMMYGRVQQQPMLFERYYAPRPGSHAALADSIQLSPRKSTGRTSRKNNNYRFNSPERSRKVSINEAAEAFNRDVDDDFNEKLYSDSDAPLESSDK